jgi:uncharacterized repeat protein (TIGR04076 family)
MNIYKIEIEIFEGDGGTLRKEGDRIIMPDIVREGLCSWMYLGDRQRSYQVGDRFTYPQDAGRLCPWLMDSLKSIVQTLRYGGTLPWQYPDTPYVKAMDPEGVTTEYVRCPDPTASGIVVKVIRTKVGEAPSAPPRDDDSRTGSRTEGD